MGKISLQRDIYTSGNANPHVDSDSRADQRKGRFPILLRLIPGEPDARAVFAAADAPRVDASFTHAPTWDDEILPFPG